MVRSELAKIFRILDANANRLREALRVLEDVARFVLNSPALSKEYKSLRHRVSRQFMKIPVSYCALAASRDSNGDVGKKFSLQDKKKERIADVVAKNLRRAGEAARVLEEFLKLVDRRASLQFQEIRFQIYGLEKKTASKL